MGVHRRRVGEQERQTAADTARRRLERTGIQPLALVQDHLPTELQATVVSPGRRGIAGLLLVLALGAAVAWAGVWLARPGERAVPRPHTPVGHPLTPTAAPQNETASPTASSGPGLLVHVVGAVRSPGLVSLPAGARVDDAVSAAGGITARGDPASVNLARPVVDGEQLVIGRRGGLPVGSAPGPVPPLPGTPTGPVNLNTATLEQLDGLPGIGPVLAQRILDWRQAHGRFSSVDELGEVSGIGEATLSDLRAAVTV